jgi:transketolase
LVGAARAGVGHIGSALSTVEVIAALYGGVLRRAGDDDDDTFLLSKGHAALALYAALHLRGLISADDLASYCQDDSLFGVHPDHRAPGVDFSTGSLGQGLSVAAGAAQHRIRNLVAIVDANGQQALGRTASILDLEPLEVKWTAFGWQTRVVDGHDVDAMRMALTVPPDADRPLAIIARTLAGRGVSFMEGQVTWHYLPLTADQFTEAMLQVGDCACSLNA